MRIVGGKFKGRGLKAPSSSIVRPTSDRLRETIFNILAHGYDDACEGARVIDLFAGTGALGIEAMSRGATGGLFVDDSSEGRALLRANLETLGLSGIARIMRRDATKLGPMPPQDRFTLAFLDPPYSAARADCAARRRLAERWGLVCGGRRGGSRGASAAGIFTARPARKRRHAGAVHAVFCLSLVIARSRRRRGNQSHGSHPKMDCRGAHAPRNDEENHLLPNSFSTSASFSST